ncbi:M15 family metallopeptidase [Homoserinibacter sp. GY 40078]|uniref:M15 family metallopeptidase n=1 Tax=Homoserinibacter sp. GY 40078 TaxID=2603275 RepID=UPI0011C9BF7F|nr:M15 family metallopeptidase [Homoserinibacter sp. GY 40078]TXK17191.1 M15 family metallopeptidase [Homoserinibacter sp. GY 40078]
MTAPDDVVETADAAEPDTAHAPTTTRRRRSRLIAVVASLLVVLLVGGTLTGVLVSAQLAHDAAAERLDAAQRIQKMAADADRRIENDAQAASQELVALITQLRAALDVSGAGIDDEDRAALRDAIDTAAATSGDSVVSPPVAAAVKPIDADAATVEQLDAQRDRVTARTTALGERTALVVAATTFLRDAFADLTLASSSYAQATADRGDEVLDDRSDADDDDLAQLTSAVDALRVAAPDELASLLAAYRRSVDAVVTSSDAARATSTGGGNITTDGEGGGGYRIPDPASLTAVVNKQRSLSANYVPPGLRRPVGIGGALPLRAEAATAAEKMAAAMAKEGISLRMSSGYRSYSRQATIYNGFVAREGVAGADEHSARPGHSEHQLGLAADFDDGTGCNLNVCFADRPGGRWLAENSWKYGFVLRYGNGWQPIVGYRYEPWHFRYVGTTVAAEMHASGTKTLEEYFGLPAAPDYD